jgi:hypothetical protein
VQHQQNGDPSCRECLQHCKTRLQLVFAFFLSFYSPSSSSSNRAPFHSTLPFLRPKNGRLEDPKLHLSVSHELPLPEPTPATNNKKRKEEEKEEEEEKATKALPKKKSKA